MRSNWQQGNAKISVYDLAQQVRDRMSGSSANLTDGQVEEECERVVLASCEGIASYRRLTELVRFVFVRSIATFAVISPAFQEA